jgi:anti-anti-sigma factor
MKITERTLNDITVLELDGELALENNTQFRKKANAAFDAGTRKLIVNLAKVEYMDSSGLGELISCYTTLKKLGGRLALLQLNHRLQHLLTITKLYTVFETFETEAAAVASFTTLAESETSSNASVACLS